VKDRGNPRSEVPVIQFVSELLLVFFLILLGVYGGRRKFLGEDSMASLRWLVSSVTLPLLLFSAFAKSHIEGRHMVIELSIFISCGLMGLAGHFFSRKFSMPEPGTRFLFQGFEAGMLGYALFSSFFGTDQITVFASGDLGQVLYVFTILMMQFLRSEPGPREGKADRNLSSTLRQIAGSVIRSPVVIAIALGLVVSRFFGSASSMLPWNQGGFLSGTISGIGGLTTPLVCIVVGYGFRHGLKGGRDVFLAIGLRILVAGILGSAIALILIPAMGLSKIYTYAILVLFMLPPPFVIPIFYKGKQDSDYISSVLSMHTIASMAIITSIALVYRRMGI
jgi:predicted permease